MKILTTRETNMMNKDNSYEHVFGSILSTEGGKVNHKSDKGGCTNMGITQYFLDLIKLDMDVNDLTVQQAKEIYFKHFYLKAKLNRISDLKLKEFLMELFINMNPKSYGLIVQKAYNVMVDGRPLVEDGVAGKMTMSKLNQYPDKKRLIEFLIIEACVHYRNLAIEDESQEVFLYGWYNRVLKFLK